MKEEGVIGYGYPSMCKKNENENENVQKRNI
jgi:hypothetical protein